MAAKGLERDCCCRVVAGSAANVHNFLHIQDRRTSNYILTGMISRSKRVGD